MDYSPLYLLSSNKASRRKALFPSIHMTKNEGNTSIKEDIALLDEQFPHLKGAEMLPCSHGGHDATSHLRRLKERRRNAH